MRKIPSVKPREEGLLASQRNLPTEQGQRFFWPEYPVVKVITLRPVPDQTHAVSFFVSRSETANERNQRLRIKFHRKTFQSR